MSKARRSRLRWNTLEKPCLALGQPRRPYAGLPSDPIYSQYQWDMQGGFGSNAIGAWNAGYSGLNAKAVVVGVVDEGIQYSHVDLKGRVGNPGEIAGNGKDDDGNGFVDDVYGWDFYSTTTRSTTAACAATRTTTAPTSLARSGPTATTASASPASTGTWT